MRENVRKSGDEASGEDTGYPRKDVKEHEPTQKLSDTNAAIAGENSTYGGGSPSATGAVREAGKK